MSGPVVLVFDSGLGGLTVYREIVRAAPAARFVYVADDAVFPYGALTPEALVARVNDVMDAAIARWRPDIVVIACHTASTLVLPHLRARHAIPFVGTVPAIKPAVSVSRSRMISVLATPGTVARDYTRDLVRNWAGDCAVALVGSRRLATLAEQAMAGEPLADSDIGAELAPCFNVSADGARRTDAVVLACTHYPLLLERFRALAPWPVEWIDPAPAIARRTVDLLGQSGFDVTAGQAAAPAEMALTGGARLNPALRAALGRFGLERIHVTPVESAAARHPPAARAG
ncbi:glutamate racemase [Camelimonas sp. ID_303_24]